MKVLLTTYTHDPEEITEVDKLLAASDIFPYWVLWYPEDTDGKVRVRFIPQARIMEIELIGEPDEPKLASVTELRPQGV